MILDLCSGMETCLGTNGSARMGPNRSSEAISWQTARVNNSLIIEKIVSYNYTMLLVLAMHNKHGGQKNNQK